MGNPNFLRGRISNSQASCQKLGFPERKDFIEHKEVFLSCWRVRMQN